MSEQSTSSEPAAAASEPLSALRPGERGKIVGFDLPGSLKGRIMEMGITQGVAIEMVRFAPLGDPMEFKVRGSHLSLRKADAAGIRVQRL
jgi:Fe2+ transport system protein FeoA